MDIHLICFPNPESSHVQFNLTNKNRPPLSKTAASVHTKKRCSFIAASHTIFVNFWADLVTQRQNLAERTERDLWCSTCGAAFGQARF